MTKYMVVAGHKLENRDILIWENKVTTDKSEAEKVAKHYIDTLAGTEFEDISEDYETFKSTFTIDFVSIRIQNKDLETWDTISETEF